MSNILNKNTGTALLALGTIFWALWVILDYTAYHPYLSHALLKVPYLKVLLPFFLLMGGLGVWWYRKKQAAPKASVKISYRGGWLFLGVYFFSVIILVAYVSAMNFPQKDFGQRVFSYTLFGAQQLGPFSIILLAAYALGAAVLRPLEKVFSQSIAILSLITGFSLLGLIAVLLGLFGVLNFVVMWIIVAGILLLWIQKISGFLKSLLIEKRQLKLSHAWHLPLIMLLLLVTAVNLIGAFKPYPTGYDGSYLYMNLSRLISESQALPAGGQAFNWSVVMSLGQVLFNSETLSILLSHLMSLLSLLVLFRIARLWLRPAYALLAVSIPYLTPYFAFHCLVDEKVDLAFLLISGGIALMALEYWVKSRKKDVELPATLALMGGRWTVRTEIYIWLVIGWLCGFAFGMKYTAIMVVIAVGSLPFYQYGKKWAYTGYFLLSIGALFFLRIHEFGYIDISGLQSLLLGGVLMLAGTGLIYWGFREDLQKLLKPVLLVVGLGATMTLAYAPWLAKHFNENRSLSVQSLIQGKSSAPTIEIAPKYLGKINPQRKKRKWQDRQFGHQRRPRSTQKAEAFPMLTAAPQDPEPTAAPAKKAPKNQLARDEVRRYLGYESGLWLYTSLPYDLTMNLNITELRYLDISFLFLLLFPLLLFSLRGSLVQLLKNIGIILGLVVWLASCYYAKYLQSDPSGGVDKILIDRGEFFLKHPGGAESGFYSAFKAAISPIVQLADGLSGIFRLGDQLSFPLILLVLMGLFVGIYGLLRSKIDQMSSGFKALLAFLLAFLFVWLILGNGIVWYAFPLWALLPIVLVYYFQRPERLWGEAYQPYVRHFFGAIFGLFILMNSLLYFTNPNFGGQVEALYSWQFVEYASNSKMDKEKTIKIFNASFPKAIEQLNANKEEKIYRINTFLGYHIDENDKRVYSDNVLGRFDAITRVTADDSYFIDILKDNGFRYILYDLSTPVIDQSAGQNLREKCNKLISILINSDKVELVVTDNYVADPNDPVIALPNGQRINGRTDIVGKVAYLGSYVLYKIL